MATFGIVMAGIVAGSLLLMVVGYLVLRLIGLVLLLVVRLLAFVVGAFAHVAGAGVHAAVLAMRRPQHRHRPA